MRLRYFIFYLLSLGIIASCSTDEGNINYEPKITVIFLDTILNTIKTTDSMKVRINSINGNDGVFTTKDSLAKFLLPLKMDSNKTYLSINYTFHRLRNDTIKSSKDQDSVVIVAYPITKEKSFSIEYTLTPKVHYDRFLFDTKLLSLTSSDKDSISLSCTDCYTNEAVLYIYESRHYKK